MKLTGNTWKYGDDINTDVIFPGKYTYTMTNVADFKKVALEDLDPEFNKNVRPGDIVVGGRNFGCGSSREQAAVCFKVCGVKVIIAKSFGRIFFRNCVNNGVLPVVCPEAVDAIEKGDQVTVDLEANTVSVLSAKSLVLSAGDAVIPSTKDSGLSTQHSTLSTFPFPPLSKSITDIIDAGGLILMLRKKLGTEHMPMPELKFSAE